MHRRFRTALIIRGFSGFAGGDDVLLNIKKENSFCSPVRYSYEILMSFGCGLMSMSLSVRQMLNCTTCAFPLCPMQPLSPRLKCQRQSRRLCSMKGL